MPGNETPASLSCVTGLSQRRSGASAVTSGPRGQKHPRHPPHRAPAPAAYSRGDASHPALRLDGTWGDTKPFRCSRDGDTRPRRTQTDGRTFVGCQKKCRCHVCEGNTSRGSPPVCAAAPHVKQSSRGQSHSVPSGTHSHGGEGYFTKKTVSHYLPVSNMPLKPALHQNPRSDKRSDLEEREEGREELKLKQLEDKLELNLPEKRVISSQRKAPFGSSWFISKGHIEKPKSRGRNSAHGGCRLFHTTRKAEASGWECWSDLWL